MTTPEASATPVTTVERTCCIAGCGPAGAMHSIGTIDTSRAAIALPPSAAAIVPSAAASE